MKKIFSILLAALFSFSSCSFFEDDEVVKPRPEEGKAYVTFSVNNDSIRSISHGKNVNDLTDFTFAYKANDSDDYGEMTPVANNLVALNTASVEVPLGNWIFKLSAKLGETEFSGETKAEIKAGENQNLSFTLAPPEGTKGGVSITVMFSGDARPSSVRVTFSKAGETSTAESLGLTGDTVVFAKDNLAPGQYSIKFDFAGQSDILLTSYGPEIVNVSAGITTEYAMSININDEYTITYERNGGTCSEPMVSTYSARSDAITLPVPVKTGYVFAGWYEDSEFSGTPVTEITKGSTGDKTFYACFTDSIYVSGSGKGVNSGLTPAQSLDSMFNAVQKIIEYSASDVDWNIVIDGTVRGNQSVNGLSAEHAKSLTIKGAHTVTAADQLTDILDSRTESGDKGITLNIQTDVYESKKLPVTLKNLKITGGEAPFLIGAGLNVYPDSEVSTSGIVCITGNTSASGAGVYVQGKFTVNDGCTITDNTATDQGGGVYVEGTLELCGGTISENTVSTTGKGAGVYVRNAGGKGTLRMSGTGSVAVNNDVYLETGTTITIAGALSGGDGTGCVAKITPAVYEEGTVILSVDEDSGTTLDAEYMKFAVTPHEDSENLYVGRDGTLITDVDIESVVNSISSMTETGTVTVRGKMQNSDLATIATAVKSSTVLVTLDMEDVVGLTEIPGSTFTSCSKLQSITIPEGVTKIGYCAFRLCGNLTSITLPDSLKSIATEAIEYCTNLQTVNLGNGIETLEAGAFNSCTSLTEIHIPASLKAINFNGAFRKCVNLKTITVAEDSEYFEAENGILFNKGRTALFAYPSCTGEYDVPDTVTKITGAAFNGSGITAINLNKTETIEVYVFEGCTGLTSITFPDSLTSIGSDSFCGCTGLTSLYIGSGLKNMDMFALYGCTSLTNITVSSENATFKVDGGALFKNNGKTLVCYPACPETYTIPDGVEVISRSAFPRTLKTLVMPASVQTIEYDVFASGFTLTVYYKGTEEQKNSISIDAENNGITSATWVYIYKSAPDAVGDIVLNNGTAIAYVEGMTLSEDKVAAAVGVVYDLDANGKPRGILGLKNSGETTYSWAPNGTTGNSTDFTDIGVTQVYAEPADGTPYCQFEYAGSSYYLTGDLDGSDNWEYIKTQDSSGSSNAAANYPAFNWVNDYASTAGLTGDYAEGWYMPSIAELWYIYKNREELDAVLSAINTVSAGAATTLGNEWDYLSSSQIASNEYVIWKLIFSDGEVSQNNYKESEQHVCVVRSANATPEYAVIFSTNGGSLIASQKVQKNQTATAPESDPTKSGYIFGGWYTSSDGGTTLSSEPFDFSTEITGHTVLYAKWSDFVLVEGATINGAVSSSSVFVSGKTVTIENLYVCNHEVTQGEFTKIMGVNPSYFNSNPAAGEIQENRPVDQVNWYMTIAYCNKRSLAENLTPCYSVEGISDWESLNFSDIPTTDNSNWNKASCDFTADGYRLPTRAEWEYAARGGNGLTGAQMIFSGHNTSLPDVGWYIDNASSMTHEVRKKSPNALGLYDMSGNLYEWVWDAYNADGSSHYDCGGSWLSYYSDCYVYSFSSPNSSWINYGDGSYFGFRVVRTAD